MTLYTAEVFIRNIETEEVVRRSIHIVELNSGERLEIWVDDKLKYEEEEPLVVHQER